MPFVEDDQEVNFDPIQSDLLSGGAGFPSDDGVEEAPHATVVALDEPEEELNEDEDQDADNMPPAPVADTGESEEEHEAAPASTRKRGRGAAAKKGTAAPVKSTRATKKVAAPKSTPSRKRKAAAEPEAEEEAAPPAKRGRPRREPTDPEAEQAAGPSAKRGRPPRATALSARLAAKEANRPKRGRPAKNGAATATSKALGRRGRPKKSAANGETPKGEYEVEAIVDSAIDADTMEHKYLVKWKGWDAEANSWEPKSNLTNSMDLVRKFDASKKTTKKDQVEAEGSAEPPKKRSRKPGKKGQAAVEPAADMDVEAEAEAEGSAEPRQPKKRGRKTRARA